MVNLAPRFRMGAKEYSDRSTGCMIVRHSSVAEPALSIGNNSSDGSDASRRPSHSDSECTYNPHRDYDGDMGDITFQLYDNNISALLCIPEVTNASVTSGGQGVRIIQ